MHPLPKLVGIAAALAASSFALGARAQFDDSWNGKVEDAPAERRSGFTFGVHIGPAIGNASGYPNEAEKLNVPEFEADTGLAFGNSATLTIGGALKDWFVFDLGFSSMSFDGDVAGSGFGFIIRPTAFPLFYEAREFRDLGVFGQFGIATMNLDEGDTRVAEGGAMSLVGGGAFWEPWQLGSFNFGPALEYRHLFSQTLTAHQATLAIRAVFYGGPGDPPAKTAARR